MNSELETIWKEAVMAYPIPYPDIYLDVRCPGRGLRLATPGYRSCPLVDEGLTVLNLRVI
jgi:hypothetical protein